MDSHWDCEAHSSPPAVDTGTCFLLVFVAICEPVVSVARVSWGEIEPMSSSSDSEAVRETGKGTEKSPSSSEGKPHSQFLRALSRQLHLEPSLDFYSTEGRLFSSFILSVTLFVEFFTFLLFLVGFKAITVCVLHISGTFFRTSLLTLVTSGACVNFEDFLFS